MLAPVRRVVALLLPALLAVSLFGACGDDDSGSVTELLDKAFKTSIGSADLTLDIAIELDGIDELQDPIEIALTGPYDSREKGQIPSLDWDITVGAQNQSFNANLTSTGDRAFVGFQGTDYEVSPETVQELNRQLAASENEEGKCDLSDFGVRARDWLVDAEEEGEEEVADVETTHVSGKLDISRVLDDLNKVVQEASNLCGEIGAQVPPALTEDQKGQIEDVVQDPTFDAYVGNDDDVLHRLSADIDFEVPEDSREDLGGLEGGRLSFSIEFANVGEAQSITAPDNPRPIAELTQQLEGLLGGAAATPETGGGTTTTPPQTDAEKQKAYEDCVSTDPNDESVRAFCEALLQ